MQMSEIQVRIEQAFPGAQVQVAGEGCNAEVLVVAEQFEGQGRLQRQRAVLALFGNEIASGEIHALSVKARAPAEV